MSFFNDTNLTNSVDLSVDKIELWPNTILLAIYLIVFLIGLFGNLLTIYMVLFFKKMQSMTNKFISNLALADLLVIFLVIPENSMRLMHIQPPDIGGQIFCKFTSFIHGITLGVSVMTLTAISIDRYYIIYKPMKARSISRARVKLVVSITWFFSIVIMSPMLLVMKYEEIHIHDLTNNTSFMFFNKKFVICKEEWPNLELKLIYNIFLAFILFLFPVIFMSYAYIKVSKTLCSAERKDTTIIKKVKIVNSFTMKQNIKYKTKTIDESITRFNDDLNSQIEENSRIVDENKIVLKETKREISYSYCSSEKNSVEQIFETNKNDIELVEKTIERNSQNSKKSHLRRSVKNDHSAVDSLYYQLKIIKKSKGKTRLTQTTTTPVNNKNEKAINKLLTSRRRVVRLLIILVVLFFISWLPYHIIGITIDLMHICQGDEHISRFLVENIFPVTLFLAHANSAQNPICFLILRRDFSKTFSKRLKCCSKNF